MRRWLWIVPIFLIVGTYGLWRWRTHSGLQARLESAPAVTMTDADDVRYYFEFVNKRMVEVLDEAKRLSTSGAVGMYAATLDYIVGLPRDVAILNNRHHAYTREIVTRVEELAKRPDFDAAVAHEYLDPVLARVDPFGRLEDEWTAMRDRGIANRPSGWLSWWIARPLLDQDAVFHFDHWTRALDLLEEGADTAAFRDLGSDALDLSEFYPGTRDVARWPEVGHGEAVITDAAVRRLRSMLASRAAAQ